jgi:hypothetical protein
MLSISVVSFINIKTVLHCSLHTFQLPAMMGCLALSLVVVLPLVLVVVKALVPEERAVAKRASEIFIVVWMYVIWIE